MFCCVIKIYMLDMYVPNLHAQNVFMKFLWSFFKIQQLKGNFLFCWLGWLLFGVELVIKYWGVVPAYAVVTIFWHIVSTVVILYKARYKQLKVRELCVYVYSGLGNKQTNKQTNIYCAANLKLY